MKSLVAVLLFLSLLMVAGESSAQQSSYGPYACENCVMTNSSGGVQAVPTDPTTVTFLTGVLVNINSSTTDGVEVGDSVVVCNGDTCVSYVYQGDGNWLGDAYAQNQIGGYGAGSGYPIFGGAGPWAGCVAGCGGGTVIVDPLKPVKDGN